MDPVIGVVPLLPFFQYYSSCRGSYVTTTENQIDMWMQFLLLRVCYYPQPHFSDRIICVRCKLTSLLSCPSLYVCIHVCTCISFIHAPALHKRMVTNCILHVFLLNISAGMLAHWHSKPQAHRTNYSMPDCYENIM